MISTSEIKISVVIEQKSLEIAVQALHNEFKLDKNNNLVANLMKRRGLSC